MLLFGSAARAAKQCAGEVEGIAEALGDHVAHGALGIGDDEVEGRGSDLGGSCLVADEVDAGLGAIAMGDDDLVPVADHADDGVHALAGIRELLLGRALGSFLDDGVAAEGDDDGLPVVHDDVSFFGSAAR